MNKLHQLQTEAREDVARQILWLFPEEMPLTQDSINQFTDKLVAHVYRETVKECIRKLPGWDDGAEDRSQYSEGYNRCSDDAHENLERLISTKD